MIWIIILIICVLIDSFIRIIWTLNVIKSWNKNLEENNEKQKKIQDDFIKECEKNLEEIITIYKKENETLTKSKNKEIEKIKLQANTFWQNLMINNLNRYGVVGNFKFGDFDFSAEYKTIGIPIYFTNGVIKNKLYISSDDITENMKNLIRNNPDIKIYATDDSISDKYFVEIFLQDNMNEFIYNDKDLYENVEVGDEITVSHDEKKLLTLGFKLKERNS